MDISNQILARITISHSYMGYFASVAFFKCTSSLLEWTKSK
ncbi:uncharacterized protein J3R85_020249 [Psidium guajava]|nr:uncharacterized protein J3R85_020249 [Psidium guajava]